MPLTLSYLDLNRFMARRMAKWRTVPRLVLLTVSSERRTCTRQQHTCLRTTAGFRYRKANRQKARGELDLPPFVDGALDKVPRGWFRRATRSFTNKRGAKYLVQCTVERQETGWFLAHTVGPSDGGSTKRAIKK
jgi:hypothetical protein